MTNSRRTSRGQV